MEEKSTFRSPLENKKISVFPILRQGDWGPSNKDPKTKGSMLPGSHFKVCGLVYDETNRKYIDPLTTEEKAWAYSDSSGLNIAPGDLNPLKKPNFWSKFQVVLRTDALILDLNEPMDWMRYKFLTAQVDKIALDKSKINNNISFKYYLKDSDAEAAINVGKIAREKEVNRYFYKIENDKHKLSALLKMYNYTTRSSKKLPKDADINFLTNEVYSVIKNDLATLYDIVKDEAFETKLLIYESIDKGTIEKLGAAEYKIVGEEDVLNMKDLIAFLVSKKNQAIRLKLDATLEN